MNPHNPVPPCPAPAILAAFVEGKLDAETTRVIAHHIADCPECVQVAGDTVAFLAEEQEESDSDAEPARVAWTRRTSLAAALAVSCIVWLAWYATAGRDPLRRLRALAEESKVRTVEGRLDRFPYARLAVTRSERSAASVAQRAEVERLLAERSPQASWSHAVGVAALLAGDLPAATRFLSEAARLAPRDAAVWSDLAVARIASGAYADAREAADRAVTLRPDAPAAHFNRALALARVGRPADAARAYRTALTLETDPRWRAEIEQRLSDLAR